MSLQDRIYELTAPEDVDEFLEKFPTSAFFKAGGCHKTMQGFGYVEQALNGRENISLGFVRVIEHRPASNYIAEKTHIVHQSPQFILLVDGKPVYDVDNWDITPEALEAALNEFLGPASEQGTSPQKKKSSENIQQYRDLLEQFLSGSLSEDEFETHWLMTFQADATQRSTEEFQLLNSLFGDVDAAIMARTLEPETTNHRLALATTPKNSLRQRAERLLQNLRAQ